MNKINPFKIKILVTVSGATEKLRAFTLAEVLITLAIISVVASLTIPALMNNIKNQKLVVALQKDYSTLSQATQMIVNDNGGSIKGLCSDGDNDCLRNLYGNYIKELKTCNNGSSNGVCWHSNSDSHYLNGNPVNDWDSNTSVGVSINGGFIRFARNTNNCDSNLIMYVSNLKNNEGCGIITIDVNGFTPPNVVGRDIFYFSILENKIVPWGTDLDTFTCKTTDLGYGCAGKVLKEGAINY